MKKMKNFALMSAIALTSAVGFTACSSSEDATADVNPTFDGNTIRTDFAFSIAGGPMGVTRMTGDNTLQADNAFLGMKNMFLLPFGIGNTNVGPVLGSTTSTGGAYALGSLGSSEISGTQSSKVYSLQIPVGTDNFLFYGTVDNSTVTALIKRGALESSLASTTSKTDDISFKLKEINGNLNKDLAGNTTDDATKLANYLTNIAQVKITSGSTDINWSDAPTKAATIGQYSTLATLYNNFTSIKGDRAGSAEAILRTVLDLYRTAKGVIMEGNASTSDVYKIAEAICDAIKDGDKTAGCYKVTITETPPVAPATIAPETWTAAWSGLTNTTFPHNLLLPMGAAQLNYNTSTRTFSYETSPNYTVTDYTTNPLTYENVPLGKIRYPAELIYFDNSALRATNSYKTVADYPKTVANWDANLGSTGFSSDWSGTRVEPSTRAVAMQNNVNYGVALLQTKVQMDTGSANMEDNMKGIHPSATDNQKDIDGTKFTLTGILIGGQPTAVGYDMTNPSLPTVGTSDPSNGKGEYNNVIYDQDIPFTSAISESLSEPNYTLVLDNYTDGTQQNTVRFALELVNGSGKDFYGLNGIIPAGHTFYLCGELNPNATTGITNYTKADRPAWYRVTKEDKQRVFMQDYKTVANITISNDALKKAYNTIPDLRSTELLFGLSVDLKWEAGMQFTVEL